MPWHCISVVLCGGLYAEYKTCHVTLCTNYVVTNRYEKSQMCWRDWDRAVVERLLFKCYPTGI